VEREIKGLNLFWISYIESKLSRSLGNSVYDSGEHATFLASSRKLIKTDQVSAVTKTSNMVLKMNEK
jgi:hypothetical protein